MELLIILALAPIGWIALNQWNMKVVKAYVFLHALNNSRNIVEANLDASQIFLKNVGSYLPRAKDYCANHFNGINSRMIENAKSKGLKRYTEARASLIDAENIDLSGYSIEDCRKDIMDALLTMVLVGQKHEKEALESEWTSWWLELFTLRTRQVENAQSWVYHDEEKTR